MSDYEQLPFSEIADDEPLVFHVHRLPQPILVPRRAITEELLTLEELGLYTMICSYDGNADEDYIIKSMKLTIEDYTRLVRSLENKGYVEVNENGNSPTP